MGLRVKEYRNSEGEEVSLLLGPDGVPLLLPNRFVFTKFRQKGHSPRTCHLVLRAIKYAHAWAQMEGEDFDDLIFGRAAIQTHQVDSLADYLGWSAHALKLREQGKVAVLSKTQAPGVSVKKQLGVGDEEYANRMRYVANYIEWLMTERANQGKVIEGTSKTRLSNAVLWLRGRVPKTTPKHVNEKLEAIEEQLIEKMILTLHPDSPENPFQSRFVKARNYLLVLQMIECGGRRNEIRHVKAKDVQAGQNQLDIHVSKTRPRTIPFSEILEDAFNQYFEEFWLKFPRNVRNEGYLFLTEKGNWLSLRSINAIFETIRNRVGELPSWVHPHSLRRSFVERVMTKIKALQAQGMVFEQQEIARNINDLAGWSSNSKMGHKYAAKLLRKSADNIAQEISKDMSSVFKKGQL